MITADALTSELSRCLSNVTSITPDVLRGERAAEGGSPYAVYFFALSSDLREWADNLEERQDEIIGPSYFRTPGDLRWNHYLYLLTSTEATAGNEFSGLKRVIEEDRAYARKFVLTEAELPETLEALRPLRHTTLDVVQQDVVGKWTKRLVENQLGVVLDKRTVAETVREISTGTIRNSPVSAIRSAVSSTQTPRLTEFIDALEVVDYRDWPSQRRFENLGTVNLIVGANGAGKTSLLDAIEFLYCLENLRTPAPANARLRVKLRGQLAWTDVRATSSNTEAKRRNFEWYGQRDLRGSTLPNSFARFNYLSTDEAALLGQKDADLGFEEMMSRLVAGPQAAELWDHMGRLQEALETERSRQRAIINEAVLRRKTLEQLVAATESIPRLSDPSLSAIVEDLSRLGWKGSVTRENFESNVVPRLNRAWSLVRQIAAVKLSSGLGSRAEIRSALGVAEQTLLDVDVSLQRISNLDEADRYDVLSRGTALEAIDVAGALKSAHELGAFELMNNARRMQDEISALQMRVAQWRAPDTVPVWISDLSAPLSSELLRTAHALSENVERTASLEIQLDLLRQAQSASFSLVAEIRSLAKKLLREVPTEGRCPICATEFEVGGLERQLEVLEGESTVDRTAPILDALLKAQETQSDLQGRLDLLTHLSNYLDRSGQETDIKVPLDALRALMRERSELVLLQEAHSRLLSRLSELALAGIDDQEAHRLQMSANALGINPLAPSEIEAAKIHNVNEVARIDSLMASRAEERAAILLSLRSKVRIGANVVGSIDEIVERLLEERNLLQSVVGLIVELEEFLAISDDTTVVALAPLLESAAITAANFAKALEDESNSRSPSADPVGQLEEVDAQMQTLVAAELAVLGAIQTLTTIAREDSLHAATEAELHSAQEETNRIFRRIHSPHEYGVRRDSRAPLFRLDGTSSAVTLRNVSTGQRAAFVLSVFLAMNAKLQSAPPVLLFDDPVAHIDDFNALSFLDHLRDLALTEERQVFYATADSRLAGLFEHKFSFMGDQFKRIDLNR
jgi:DNA repair protein SbcC/Rad50